MGDIIGSNSGNAGNGSVIPTTADSYNRELIFDLSLGAFSLYDMGHDNFPTLNDYVPVTDFYSVTNDDDVVHDDGSQLVDDNGNTIIASLTKS